MFDFVVTKTDYVKVVFVELILVKGQINISQFMFRCVHDKHVFFLIIVV